MIKQRVTDEGSRARPSRGGRMTNQTKQREDKAVVFTGEAHAAVHVRPRTPGTARDGLLSYSRSSADLLLVIESA